MSKLRDFVEAAGEVATVQDTILNAMERLFAGDDYRALEATILAPGYEGWEARAIRLLKTATNERWEGLNSDIAALAARFSKPVSHPDQSPEYWVDPLTSPHLRVYWCLRCGHRATSMALSGICCHGQPECPRCHHQVHETNCRRNQPAAKGPEKP